MSCRKCGKLYPFNQMCPIYHGEKNDAVCIPCCKKCKYYKFNDLLGLMCQFWEENPIKKAEYELSEAIRREREASERLDYCYDCQSDAMIAHANRRYHYFKRARMDASANLVREKRKAGLI